MIVSPCNAPTLTAKGLRKALVAGSALLCLLSAGQLFAFNLDDVSAKAKTLAGQKYEAPRSNLPNEFRDMKFADYQKIRFLTDKAEWAGEKTPSNCRSTIRHALRYAGEDQRNHRRRCERNQVRPDPFRFR
ncbi:glucan biosynthesis protein [Pseudomonas sp. PCH446]